MNFNPPIRLHVLPAILPVNGRDIELRATSTDLQWRYVTDHNGEYAWSDLLPLSVLVGPEGPAVEFRSDGEYLQYRPVGASEDAWRNVVALTELNGPPGDPGAPGEPGEAGASAYEIAVANGFVGTEEEWLASLTGGPGPGLPAGGTTGQVPKKASDADHDIVWEDEAGGVGDGEVTEPKLAEDLRQTLPLIVESIAAMKAVTSDRPVLVRSYYGDGLGGGGKFFPDPSDITTPDNGGSVIVRNDGMRMKRDARAMSLVDVTEWGCSPDLANNTDRYNAIIAAASQNAVITWPQMSGVWIGSFVSSKPFHLKLGKNRFQEVDRVTSGQNLPVFKFAGSKALLTTLSANAKYGDKTLALTSAAGLAVGSIIELEDQTTRPTDSAKVNQEILRVASVNSGTVIAVEDMVRSYQDNGTRNVYLITPVVGAVIEGGISRINNPYRDSQLSNPATWGHSAPVCEIEYGDGCRIIGVDVSNYYSNPARLKECIDSKNLGGIFSNPSEITSGAGYGATCYIGRNIEIAHFQAHNTRNAFDFDAVYCGHAHHGSGHNIGYGGTIAHNGFGGGNVCEHLRFTGLSGNHGLGTSVQDRTDGASKMILRDMTIRHCFFDTTALASAASSAFMGVKIPQSWANLIIDDITIGTGLGSSTPANNAILGVRLDGYAAGPTVLRKICQADPTSTEDTTRGLNWAVWLEGFTTSLGPNSRHHLIIVEDCNIYWGQGVVRSRGMKHLTTKNLTAQFLASGTEVKVVETGSGTANVTNVSIGVHALVS